MTAEPGRLTEADKSPGTALVLAGPERRRILREILARPEPWTVAQTELYVAMLYDEWYATSIAHREDGPRRALEERAFTRLVVGGVSTDRAIELARQAASDALEVSPGRTERTRRRRRRKAVTALDGRSAVTTGTLESCVVCDAPLYRSQRTDRAYCSNACRQKAYRHRRRADS